MVIAIVAAGISVVVLALIPSRPRTFRLRASLAIATAVLIVTSVAGLVRSSTSATASRGDETSSTSSMPMTWRLDATKAQIVDTQALVWDTHVALHGIASIADAERQGFVRVSDELLIDPDRLTDGKYLYADLPEGLVTERRGGAEVIVGAQFQMDRDQSMRDVPRMGGALVPWHAWGGACLNDDKTVTAPTTTHDELCGSAAGGRPSPPFVRVFITARADGATVRSAERCGTFAFIDPARGSRVPGCTS